MAKKKKRKKPNCKEGEVQVKAFVKKGRKNG